MNETAEKQWLGHPRGLSTLFFTEMWERFSYYGMRALLVLYMTTAVTKGGLGFSTEKAGPIYGFYTFGVYGLSLIGGIIADRFLGLYRSVLVGGIIIALGHFSMAFRSLGMFYFGLVLIVVGTSLLKPNVSSMVGTLYNRQDARRDAGFSIFYMGINLGAFIAPLITGPLGQKVNWHYGFAAAGIGMTLGVIQYVFGRRYLVGEDAPRTDASVAREERKSAAKKERFTRQDWRRIGVIFILFLFSILFWMAFEQAGSSFNLFAERYTNLNMFGWNIPASTLQSVQPIFIIIFAPVFAALWTRLGRREPSSPAKFSMALVLVGLGMFLIVPAAAMAQNQGIKVSPWWLIGVYLLHTFGELCLSPVGLSVTTKLAPPRIVGMMMGVWFGSIALGNLFAGFAASLFDKLPLPKLFGAVGVMTIAAGVILALLVGPIRRMMGDVK
ncbi:MAG TPA: peptide MFS transporter [Thermoanaerobaculia bacterium]|nr:peptide MFS transporter [Thermoanaerobaculia bacterium]